MRQIRALGRLQNVITGKMLLIALSLTQLYQRMCFIIFFETMDGDRCRILDGKMLRLHSMLGFNIVNVLMTKDFIEVKLG